MISLQAQQSLDRIFRQAIETRLKQASNDLLEISVAGLLQKKRSLKDRVVVLTISSMAFRVLLIFHLDRDAATRQYLAGGESDESALDAFLEVCNLCCGAVNQELLRYFPDLGMSTPYVLNASSVAHLEPLQPNYVSSYRIVVNQSVELAATLCLCAHQEVDFNAEPVATVDSGGELELF
jgi:hypothetical protein